jgi:hypothetical protein
LKVLVRHCLDVHSAAAARLYLEELGYADQIPEEAKRPDFVAMSNLSDWLQHPREFSKPPDSIDLWDTRVWVWPPTGDRRRLWVFRFIYRKSVSDKHNFEGVGIVGAKTLWAWPIKMGDRSAYLTPESRIEDVYAYHCSWESKLDSKLTGLQIVEGASVEHGRQLLKAANPGT